MNEWLGDTIATILNCRGGNFFDLLELEQALE